MPPFGHREPPPPPASDPENIRRLEERRAAREARDALRNPRPVIGQPPAPASPARPPPRPLIPNVQRAPPPPPQRPALRPPPPPAPAPARKPQLPLVNIKPRAPDLKAPAKSEQVIGYMLNALAKDERPRCSALMRGDVSSPANTQYNFDRYDSGVFYPIRDAPNAILPADIKVEYNRRLNADPVAPFLRQPNRMVPRELEEAVLETLGRSREIISSMPPEFRESVFSYSGLVRGGNDVFDFYKRFSLAERPPEIIQASCPVCHESILAKVRETEEEAGSNRLPSLLLCCNCGLMTHEGCQQFAMKDNMNTCAGCQKPNHIVSFRQLPYDHEYLISVLSVLNQIHHARRERMMAAARRLRRKLRKSRRSKKRNRCAVQRKK